MPLVFAAIIAYTLIFLAFAFIAVWFSLTLWPAFFRGALYVPTPKKRVGEMVEMLKIRPGEKAADLGSGDGRLVIALARAGAEAHGYEVSPFLVWYSRQKIRQEGLKGKAFIHFKSFFKADFKGFTAITLYALDPTMKILEKKLEKELPQGARISANAFEFPNWKPEYKKNEIYFYVK